MKNVAIESKSKERTKFGNKKGRDLSQNLFLGVESLFDPSCHYYSYLQKFKKSLLGKRLKNCGAFLIELPSRYVFYTMSRWINLKHKI